MCISHIWREESEEGWVLGATDGHVPAAESPELWPFREGWEQGTHSIHPQERNLEDLVKQLARMFTMLRPSARGTAIPYCTRHVWMVLKLFVDADFYSMLLIWWQLIHTWQSPVLVETSTVGQAIFCVLFSAELGPGSQQVLFSAVLFFHYLHCDPKDTERWRECA